MRFSRKQFLDFARHTLGKAELWFLRGVHWAGAARVLLPLSTVVGALISRRRFLRISHSNYTLGLIFCSKFEAEYCLCINRGRSCLEVCTADVIHKFQISVWCLNKVRSSSVIQFHRHYVVSVTLDSVLKILSMQC